MRTRGVEAKEWAVLSQIGPRPAPGTSQRRIARSARISLGLTNLILRSLARRGLVRIRRLNRKNVRYILTPRGAAEKTRWAYGALRRTLASLREVKALVRRAVSEAGGREPVAVVGEGEAADVAELALREMGRPWRRVARAAAARPDEMVLLCTRTARAASRPPAGARVVDLSAALAAAAGRGRRIG